METPFCEVQGGFDFVARHGRTAEKLCDDDWRPSRMEIDCILGDGVVFYFSRPNCSFFHTRTTELRLNCWASWKEVDYRFVVLAVGGFSRYVLRLPRDVNNFDEMIILIYMSPVAPLDDTDILPADVTYYRLHMFRSEPDICYDESTSCRQFATQGKCSSYVYSSYCRRSCHLCDPGRGSEPKPECRFSQQLLGDWLLLADDSRGTYAVAVDEGTLTFSSLGRFVCKSKHWAQDYFKVASAYTNGCYIEHGAWQVRFGRTGGHHSKLLSDGAICNGSLSDIRPTTCTIHPLLRMRLHTYIGDTSVEDLHCTALVRFDKLTEFLVTKGSESGQMHAG